MQNVSLSPHFTLREMYESRTAEEHGIKNVPSEQAVENLRRLCEGCLEPLREALQLPVVITSGFRTKALNDIIVHSSRKSQHMCGQAADFWVQGSRFKVQGSDADSSRYKAAELQVQGSDATSSRFKVQGSRAASSRFQVSGFKSEPSRRELLIRAFREILTNPKIDFDQLILYPTFIHVSYVSRERNRRGILIGQSDGKLGYGRISLSNALKIS